MVFPELLAGVFAGYSGKDFLAACEGNGLLALACAKRTREGERRKRTWMLILELGEIVDILIDRNIQVSRLVMRRDVGGLECFGHIGYCFLL